MVEVKVYKCFVMQQKQQLMYTIVCSVSRCQSNLEQVTTSMLCSLPHPYANISALFIVSLVSSQISQMQMEHKDSFLHNLNI